MASTSPHKHPALYSPSFERDNCGFGLIAQIDDVPSHWVVETAIGALERLTHRGAVAADGKSGDGCGLLMKKPDSFLRAEAQRLGFEVGTNYAVGNIFLSQDEAEASAARSALEDQASAAGLTVAGWRVVPTDESALGAQAKATLP
ncbi:hypothetical protein GYB61_07100, partial [bacterium]|nr:hypothetical protein [bacterium]